MNVDEMIVPVHNRDYLLGVIAGAAAATAFVPSSSACVETPVEIFERLKINVSKADEKVQAQAEEKKKKIVVQFVQRTIQMMMKLSQQNAIIYFTRVVWRDG